MTVQTLHAPAFLTGTVRRLFAPSLAALDRYKTYRRSVAELEACSDRDLSDLGIYRCDIRRLARASIYGDAA